MTDQPADEKTGRTEPSVAAGQEKTSDAKVRPPRPSRAAAAAAAAKAADTSGTAATQSVPVAAETARRGAVRQQWQDEARAGTGAHDKQVRRFLLRLSLLNWAIAIVAWTISAALGIASPASIIVYSVLFVIGLVAAILAILTYLLEKFGHEAEPMGVIRGDGGGSADDVSAAAESDTAAPAAT
jgi:hypothetical protein